jgi:hypothetical protein
MGSSQVQLLGPITTTATTPFLLSWSVPRFALFHDDDPLSVGSQSVKDPDCEINGSRSRQHHLHSDFQPPVTMLMI